MEKVDGAFKGYLGVKLKNKAFHEAYWHHRHGLDIGLQIRGLREAAGLTQKKLADRMGVSQQVIARLESGEADNPTVGTLERIAQATGHHLLFRFERTRKKSAVRPSAARTSTAKAA